MKVKLSTKLVKDIKPENGKILSYLDTVTRSLELRVFPSGKKTYSLYRFNRILGRAERIVIADANEVPLSYARAETQRLVSESIVTKRSDETLKKVFELYKQVNSDQSAGHKYRTQSIFETQLAPIANIRIQKLDLILLKKFLNEKLNTYSASYTNKIRALIIKLLHFAEKELKIKLDDDYTRLKKYKEIPRNYCLKNDEIRKLFKFCNDNTNIDLAKILLLALCTGLRKESILSLRHEYYHAGWLYLPALNVKNREAQKVFIVNDLKYIFKSSKGFVFSAKTKTGYINTIEKRKTKLFKDLGITARFHDLKHTFVTACYRSGIDPHLISVLAGHKLRGMTSYYAHAQEDDIKNAYIKVYKYLKQV